jgi:Rrf2 family transcriptional regulator, cysteine metabolism repressor
LPAVKLSVRSDYAARALLGLARHHAGGGVLKVEDLAGQFQIPPNYLVQILADLKARQLVASVRGKDGGYRLARPPAEITLGEVLRAVHGQVFDSPALAAPDCPPELRAAWAQLQRTLEATADGITFQRLIEESAGKDKMYYI